MEIGGVMALKYLFEERSNNIEIKGDRKSGILY